ncbi:unnamed protein product [marine sediment metagenome]|uniref:6-hydroxymethylpterin diphosphokinase MptE-like domain-containing protein n=1 Tax=marine sediment metagenome TaxID=412755 RepID=X0Z1Y3_9ZZZZ
MSPTCYKSILDKNEELKDKYHGKRCFIIGNGPSINQQDLTKLADEYTFVCNTFYLHKQLNIIAPKFYLMREPIMLNNALFPNDIFKEMMEKINFYASQNNNTKFFFNIQYKNYIDNNKLFSRNQVYYFLFTGSKGKRMVHDVEKHKPPGRGINPFMLFLAEYLGFKAIYIIGVDLCDFKNKDEHHFYPDSFGTKLKKPSNLELARGLYLHLSDMEIFYRYFKKEGVQIFNAGVEGMLDTFPRVDYNSLFKQ